MVAINKEPIKSLCPLWSESWDLKEAKGSVSRDGWVEQKEPMGTVLVLVGLEAEVWKH